jgi:hypothetical protein
MLYVAPLPKNILIYSKIITDADISLFEEARYENPWDNPGVLKHSEICS